MTIWDAPPRNFQLGAREVHLWRVDLQQMTAKGRSWVSLLSHEEREQASYYAPTRQLHFTLGRGFLRLLLGYYLGQEARSLQFASICRGKPILRDYPLSFNLSHSGNLFLYSVTYKHPVGIDLEKIRPVPQAVSLACRFFTETEAKELQTFPSHQQELIFLKAWTRKEAYLKATGEGMLGLKAVEISLNPEAPPQILKNSREGDKIALWSLYDLSPGEGFIGALAVGSKGLLLKRFDANFFPNY